LFFIADHVNNCFAAYLFESPKAAGLQRHPAEGLCRAVPLQGQGVAEYSGKPGLQLNGERNDDSPGKVLRIEIEKSSVDRLNNSAVFGFCDATFFNPDFRHKKRAAGATLFYKLFAV
jgi:hypothetical protein